VALPAHATYLCDAPTQSIGANTGRNPVVAIQFGRSDTTGWFANHKLQDGTIIHREDQYTIMPLPMDAGVGWNGYSKRANHLWMSGYITNPSNDGAETVYYNEELHDTAKGNAVIMKSWARCYAQHDNKPAPTYRAPAPTYTAPPPSPVSAPSTSPSFTVTLNDIPGVAAVQYINVSFGNNTIYAMTLDTGCSSMTVSPAVADWLIANNKGTEMSAMNSSYADGSIHTSRHIMVNMISIAGHTAYNVEASVVAPGQNYGDMLIGLSVLQRFGKFTIDSANHQLTFG
jgi:gag-polyprotein putative aspartyl protease